MIRKVLAILLASALIPALAAPGPGDADGSPAPVWRTDVIGEKTAAVPLLSLVPGGAADSVRLTGTRQVQVFDFGVRADEVVSAARIELAFTVSPALLPRVSQVNVYLNRKLQQSVAVTEEMVGKPAAVEVVLNPKHVEDTNQLSIEFTGHYQSTCENPASDALWVDISPASRLMLMSQQVRLANDLSLFPAPFVDTHSARPTVLPFVFAAAPSDAGKTAAAVLAGVAAKAADWRGADFPVSYGKQPVDGSFAVFLTNDSRPDFLKNFPPADGPQVSVADAPGTLGSKMLVISGKTEEDWLAAARALASESLVLIGDRLRIGAAREAAPREPYDAPKWLPAGEAVPLSRLMQYPGQLTSRGRVLQPMHLQFTPAPDLFSVKGAELRLALRYRMTKPAPEENAQLRIYLNGSLAESENVPRDEAAGEMQLKLPIRLGLIGEGWHGLSPVNDFAFEAGYERASAGGSLENCRSVSLLDRQAEIDPSSTITIEGVQHYAKLPDLGLYTRSGYPFSIRADLSRTAVLMREKPSEGEMRTMLDAVGRIAAQTGVAGSLVEVVSSIAGGGAKDVIAVGTMPRRLAEASPEAALSLQQDVLSALAGGAVAGALARPLADEDDQGAAAALVSAASPFSEGGTLVALLASGPEGGAMLQKLLMQPASLGGARGSVTILGEGGETSFEAGGTWYHGELAWHHRVWLALAGQPIVIAVFAIICAVILGGGVFWFMRRLVRRRG